MSRETRPIDWTSATHAATRAVSGAGIGYALHSSLGGVLIGSLVCGAIWPSTKCFIIDVLEWTYAGARRLFHIPRIAPSEYAPSVGKVPESLEEG